MHANTRLIILGLHFSFRFWRRLGYLLVYASSLQIFLKQCRSIELFYGMLTPLHLIDSCWNFLMSYGIAIANHFLTADGSDRILGHRLGYVCFPMLCFRCYPMLCQKVIKLSKVGNSNSLLHGMAILNHVSGPGQTMQTMLMRKHSSMFSCCTHMEILLLTAVVAEALIMSLHIFTSWHCLGFFIIWLWKQCLQ
jgi:hypothetical protein